ncbi:MAG: histidine phosphatase family protein [Solobacterium sp.]|nr:histidine phosphatase family protein [Solobacterium sp.]
MKQVTFYYCVHGETLFNSAGRMQGWCDSPLTDRGRNKMLTAGKNLRSVPFAGAYVSVSERCRDSVELLMSGKDLNVTYLKSLREQFYGALEGILISSAEQEIEAIRRGDRDYSRYGGESIQNFRLRIGEIYRKIFDHCKDMDRILIVSHGGTFLELLNLLMNIPYENLLDHYARDNSGALAVTGFAGTFCCKDGEWDLLSLSDTDSMTLRRLKESRSGRLMIP